MAHWSTAIFFMSRSRLEVPTRLAHIFGLCFRPMFQGTSWQNMTKHVVNIAVWTHLLDPRRHSLSDAPQEYIPAYLLRGLIPAALLKSHDFWQDTGESCRSEGGWIMRTSTNDRNPGRWWVIYRGIIPFMAEAFRLVIYFNLPRYI